MADTKIAVAITAEAGQFQRELSSVVRNAQAAGTQIKTAFSKVTGALSLVGIGFSAGAIFDTLRTKTEEAERSVAQLNATLRLTGSSAGFTAKQIEKIGKEIEQTSVFDDDAIRAAATSLLRFRSIQGDTFRDLLRLAPDAATVLGTTLPDAAEKLARAFTDPSRGLRAFKAIGFEISEQQIDLAARLRETGDVAGSQQIIFEALRKVMAGAGEADTRGLYGSTKRLSRAFDDLEKAAGKKLFGDNHDVIEGIADAFRRWTERINETKVSLTDLGRPLELIRQSRDILASLFSGFAKPIPGPLGGRGVSGKIDFSAWEEAEAQRNAATQRQQQADDQSYEREKLRVKSLAANAASVYGSSLEQQKHFLAMRSAQLEDSYRQDLIASADYYAEQRRIAQEAARAEEDFINKQIEAKFAARNALGATPEERATLFSQAENLTNQAVKVRLGLEEKLLKIQNDEGAAIRAQQFEYEQLAARLVELTGTAGEIAATQFDRTNRAVMLKIAAGKGSTDAGEREAALAAERTINQIKTRTLQQVDLNEAQASFSRILAKVGDEQARIDLAQQAGVITTLEAINKKSEAATKYIGELQREADAMQAVADTMKEGAAGRDDLLTKIASLRLEIDQLEASSKALENTFRGIFTDALTDNLTAVVTGTKSVSDAFKDMERQIVASISRIAAQNIAESLFKAPSGGSAGGILSFIPSLFGKLFGGGFASGGIPPINQPVLVGERGAEVFVPRTAGVIVPNDVLQSKRAQKTTIINNINVPAGTTSASASQIALEIGRAVHRSMRNA